MVKAFNTFSQETFEIEPEALQKTGAAGFLCGDHEAANKTVAELMQEIGLLPVDCGTLKYAATLEGMANLNRVTMRQRELFISYALVDLPKPGKMNFGGRSSSDLK